MSKKNYIGMGYQFHHLVCESITEMNSEGNKTLVISGFKETQSDEDSWKEYRSKTRWNDFNIGIPLLFNFYHGLELIMKGILQEQGVKFSTNHNIKTLFESISNQNDIPKELLVILKKYIFNNNPFLDVFISNDIPVFKYHLLLKYPESFTQERNQIHTFSKLRGKEKKGLDRFILLQKDIRLIKEEIINWNQSRKDPN